MGWLPDDVMYMDVTDIEAACSGRWEMVNKILGVVFGEPEEKKVMAASGSSFAAMARMGGIEVRNV